MMQTHYDDPADRIIAAMESVRDDLDTLRAAAKSATADAKRIRAVALLDARGQGYSSREERDAYADLAAVDAEQAAEIAEHTYRDALTYLRVLQSQLDLARTRMVTERDLRV